MREKLYYQDCGVLGGRTIFHTGAEFDTIESPDPIGILNDLMSKVYQDFEKNGKDHIYPFQRFAICLIHMDGSIHVILTSADENSRPIASYMDHVGKRKADYKDIDMILTMNSVQLYDIFQEIRPNHYEQLSEEETEETQSDDYHLTNIRCLDLFGCCNAPMVEKNDSFHNYIRWNLGADFYIEAMDNEETDRREFWICRDYNDAKYLFDDYETGNQDWHNLFDHQNRFVIDQHFAEFIADMSDPDEYFIIDNYFQLILCDMGSQSSQLS